SFHVELFTAPEDGVEPILQLLNSANKSVLIEQAYIYTHWGSKRADTVETAPNLFLEAAIDAARRGVTVKILLDSTWYNVEEEDPISNLHTVNYVNKIAREERLDLEASLIDFDATGLRKLHAKGVVVDDKAVLVSSINWNEHSPIKNREVGVIIYGEPAEYYAEVFECDWAPEKCRPEENWQILALGLTMTLLIAIVYVMKRKTSRGGMTGV
ncbi:MAG: phospholipase D-like domain-containing protein, partial [Candidatus Hydrothermarchaeales archaeon]